MDIYSYINSQDIAAYCREIGKTWTQFEMAVIVGRSERPMAEKHTAWRQLITDYPDMPTPKNMHYESFDSLHQKLTELIDDEERLLALFKKPEPNVVYMYAVMWHGEHRLSDSVFTSFDKLWADLLDNWERDEVPQIKVTKTKADGKGEIGAFMDYDGIIRRISIFGDGGEWLPHDTDAHPIEFYSFYVDIPLPFKRGDILTIRSLRHSCDEPVFVLDSLVTDNEPLYARYISGELGDGSDMVGWGFYVDEDSLLYSDHAHGHDSFEYYRGKLVGNNRLLHYVNLFFKDEIGLPELLRMQCLIMLEHQLEQNLRIDTHGCYLPNSLLAENRLSQEEIELLEKTNGVMPAIANKKLSIHHIEFLMKETGDDKITIQKRLIDEFWDYGGCLAGIVHLENHYEKMKDSKFNPDRRNMARFILERCGSSENEWTNRYADVVENDTYDS